MSALIYCPFPDRESARSAANILLGERLVACANILGEVESIFEWNGERGSATEIGVLFKTHAEVLDKASARLGELHPYDTPAVMGWCCDAAPQATREWLGGLGSEK
ncbi:divalent-cation tolerance protein CutA [Altererythrobacter arenosus]|uniref:Divalent-cation tolerance protein CutA n=1 Tax=Altererythrobacter arenosus TaxID=3032592 RepID=A0ABY8FUE4_9SPHN|nr:divalent-cation tolerance protein CutA [Altererythrobacter sp. CAU 1644]WFL78623.1 divalent-cation tolerance protein CutA [Altererythrobacter sp. CAU 1644]